LDISRPTLVQLVKRMYVMSAAWKSIAFVTMMASALSAVSARADAIAFRYTAHDSCLGGGPGTFTFDGNVTQPYGMFPAIGTGVITFDFGSHTASDVNNSWQYQFLPSPPGFPLNAYPAKQATGSCNYILRLGPDLSFTLQEPSTGCTSQDTTGPNAGSDNTVTFTNAPKTQGQFSADMQSFVATLVTVGVETATSRNGPSERICMREWHGVRLPK